MLIATDPIESEIVYLQSRVCTLEQCVCELLVKNELLRSALSRDGHLSWSNRPDDERGSRSLAR
jgi:hypothetical protein